MQRLFVQVASIAFFVGAIANAMADELSPLDPRTLATNVPARLTELTAHFVISNTSDSDASRFVFRVTVPPDLASQRSKLVSSDVAPEARKPHKNGVNEHLEFAVPVLANRESAYDVKFLVLTLPIDFSKAKALSHPVPSPDELAGYISPSPNIESDSAEVKQAAAIVFQRAKTEHAKAQAAYEFPAKFLKFQVHAKPLGAQKALQSRIGDCTEFACVFAALCRSQSIPARTCAVFNLGTNPSLSVKQPNHIIAEAYLSTHGWIPVDANLGRGRYDQPIGFGKLANSLIVLNYDGAWVWSTWLAPNAFDSSKPKPTIDCRVSWDARVLKEGRAADLFQEFVAAADAAK